jgi:HAD superfamily hydrolase (TIGR01509 family)
MRCEAVIFDCDGTLVDTEPAWTHAERALFRRYHQPFSLDEKRRLVGASLPETGLILERLLDQDGRAKFLEEELHQLVKAELGRGVPPMTGVVSAVEELRTRVAMAVASGSPGDLVELCLRSARLDRAFEIVVTADDVANPKPAPDVYLKACELLKVAPDRAVALEDSPRGVASAHAAGLTVVGIPSVPGVPLDADVVLPVLSAARLLGILQMALPGPPGSHGFPSSPIVS